ncbi:hypothetical protein KSP40_PGU011187 [Platanthera guangdongensis]|uniref:Uncharacterized protein n=1 Tax=Platanthera guangdongensis TaxID=2320717 RepID=A0ABR2LN16_9ASPA
MSGAKKSVGGSRGPPVAEASEVDEMLRAAEDELLMEVHVASHTISSSLDSDLARRFEALKSPRLPPHPKASQAIPPPQSSTPESKGLENRDRIHEDAANDDLMARFAALKAPTRNLQPMSNPISNHVDFSADEEMDDGDEISKKEAEKVMQWAMDAARLDPSRSDDEDNDIVKENDVREKDEEESESETEVDEKRRKIKDKGKSSRWFSLFR